MTAKRGDVNVWRVGSFLNLCAAIAATLTAGCGYGFGNTEFSQEKGTAIAFAQALEARATARMDQMSWGPLRRSIPTLVQDIPASLTRFAKPKPDILTIGGGGVYGGGGEFFLPFGRLGTCRGGVRLMMIMDKHAARVASIRLVTPRDTLAADSCRVPASGVSS